MTCPGCCTCDQPLHRKSDYGETCVKCGNHRPPRGIVRWIDDHPDEARCLDQPTPDESMERALDHVIRERYRQDTRWGDVFERLDDGLSLDTCIAILIEEAGEFAQAVLQYREGNKAEGRRPMRREAIQTAAVGLFIVELVLELERRDGCSNG